MGFELIPIAGFFDLPGDSTSSEIAIDLVAEIDTRPLTISGSTPVSPNEN